jgi:hypothetical protein
VAPPPTTKLQYPADKIGRNNIGPTGCRYLSRGQWNSLKGLVLGDASIGNESCRYLSKGHWPSLEYFQLGISRLIQ